MRTNIDIDYRPPFTFTLQESSSVDSQELVESSESVEPVGLVYEPLNAAGKAGEAPDPLARNDVGFFMALAGRFALLDAEQERVLGLTVWRERRRILRLLRAGRRSTFVVTSQPMADHRRTITGATRRRLFRVEAYARELIATRPGADPQIGSASGSSLTPAFQRELAEALARLDVAKHELAEHNLRLVVWVAKSFRGRGFDFIDLIQEGSLGLMRAIDRFDPQFGARFSTFATHWIKQGIRRALAEKARTIRIPVNRIGEVRETLNAQAKLSEILGRRPTERELAAALGREVRKVKELLPAIAPIDSIDAPIASSDRCLGETLADLVHPTPLDIAISIETKQAVKEVLNQLPERQRVILSMRHGIGHPRECTLEEIGDTLGLSRERIRQVEKQATARVRSLILQNRPTLAEM